MLANATTGDLTVMIAKVLKLVSIPILAVTLLVPLAATSLAKPSAADEKFFLQALTICRGQMTNFTHVRVDYKKRTFKCYGYDSTRRRR